jgi:signal transduction histidine kinase
MFWRKSVNRFRYRNLLALLQVRLLLLILLIFIPTVGLLIYGASEQRAFAIDTAEREALRLAQITATSHGQLIRGGEHLLSALSQVPDVYEGNTTACNQLFVQLREQYEIYTNFYMVDAAGDTICTGLPEAPPINVSELEWFQRAMSVEGFSVGDYSLGAVTGRPVVTLSYPIYESGEIKYQIGASLDLLRVTNYLTETTLPPDTYITAIDRNGTVLYRYPGNDNLIGQPHPNSTLIREILSRQEGTFETNDGQDRVYGYSPLDVTNYSAYVIVGVPQRVAYERYNGLFQRLLLMLGLVGILTLALGWYVVRRFFVRQIQALVSATNHFAVGNLQARVDMKQVEGTYELSQLARAFNEMATALQQREQQRDMAEKALREARDGLEIAVQERTQQLQFMLEASTALASSLDYETTLASVARLAVPTIADWCSVHVLEEDGLLHEVAVAHKNPEMVAKSQEMRSRYPANPNTPGGIYHVLRNCKPQMISHITDEMVQAAAQSPEHLEYLRQVGMRSIIIVPLAIREEAIGTLSLVMSDSGRHYEEQTHLQLAEELARRSAIAIENARLYQQSRIFAANEERQRLARELHDAVSQTLFSANMIAQSLPQLWKTRPQRAQEHLHQLTLLTRSAIAEMRTLLLELRPAALVDSKLSDLLMQLGDAAKGRRRMEVQIKMEGEPVILPSDVQIALYRIAQESLNNIIKHSQASEVVVNLKMDTERVELNIQDNGTGFDTSVRTSGIGLNSMRERAEAIGASFNLTSVIGGGTKTLVVWNPV